MPIWSTFNSMSIRGVQAPVIAGIEPTLGPLLAQGGLGSGFVNILKYNNGYFYLDGRNSSDILRNAVSPNGINWYNQTGTSNFTSISRGLIVEPYYVTVPAVGGNISKWSNDYLNWTSITDVSPNGCLAYNGQYFVSTTGGIILFTADAKSTSNWTVGQDISNGGAPGTGYRTMRWIDNQFIVFGKFLNATSPDGVIWLSGTPHSFDVIGALNGRDFDIIKFNSKYYTIIAGYGLLESSNGRDWSQAIATFANNGFTTDETALYGIVAGATTTSTATIRSTTDGINTTTLSTIPNCAASGMVYGDGLFVVAGFTTSNIIATWTSPDAVTWTRRL